MNVLLIEDDIQLNTTINKFLTFKEFEVVSLYDGECAISLIDKSTFDLFIIDLNIPKINGLDIVKYIRQKDLQTPIIIITASMELDNFRIAFKNGCACYMLNYCFLVVKFVFHINLFS